MKRSRGWVVLGLAVATVLSACSGGSGDSDTVGQVSSSPSTTPVSVTVSPDDGTADVRMDDPVTVTATDGSLTSVILADADGDEVAGTLAEGGGWWTSTGALTASTDYTVTVEATSDDGDATTETSTFTTLTPDATNGITLTPGDDWTVGVGMPVVVAFDDAVDNKQAAVEALTVSASPAVEGSWRWMSDTEVWWRPADYWTTGTEVKVTAAMGGVELSDGEWGERTVTTEFAIGDAMVSTVDVEAHTMTVTKNGSTLKTLPVTTGKEGYLTRNGIKVVMERQETVNMDAASTGTDPKDPEYYNLEVEWAMRLTWSGEYTHAAPWSVSSQGKENVSHGCTGLSTANAKWLFENSKVGDVIEFVNSTRELEWGNGYTLWNMDYDEWSSQTAAYDKDDTAATSTAAGTATDAATASAGSADEASEEATSSASDAS